MQRPDYPIGGPNVTPPILGSGYRLRYKCHLWCQPSREWSPTSSTPKTDRGLTWLDTDSETRYFDHDPIYNRSPNRLQPGWRFTRLTTPKEVQRLSKDNLVAYPVTWLVWRGQTPILPDFDSGSNLVLGVGFDSRYPDRSPSTYPHTGPL